MAFHHLLVLNEGSSTRETLIFKDLSEQELRASFVTPFLFGSSISRGPDDLHWHTIRARIIRTGRPHDDEVYDYLWEWGQKAEEFMRETGQPVSADHGDSAIAGAGKDVTDEFLHSEFRRAPDLFAQPKEWFCIFCGGKNAEKADEALCGSCGHVRLVLSGSATMIECSGCKQFSLGIANFCEWCGKKFGADAPPRVAPLETIGRYRVVRQLQRKYTALYEAFDPAFNRTVLIAAVPRTQESPEDYAGFLRGFRRHAHIAGRLSHPGIVPAYEAGEIDDVAYLATAATALDTLKDRMKDSQPWPVREVSKVINKLAVVLDFLHQNGIVHRDVTPEGILVDVHSNVRLSDFSIAKFLQPGEPIEEEEEGMMIGTPAYTSPENIAGRRPDGRADQFSAGIILYMLLTGKHPFRRDGWSRMAKEILEEMPEKPSEANPRLPAAYDAVVLKALAKDPNDRYARVRDLAAALRNAMVDEGNATAHGSTRYRLPLLTFLCTACAGSRLHDDVLLGGAHKAVKRYGTERPTHCTNCEAEIELVPRPYRCASCEHQWDAGFTAFEWRFDVDKGRVETCPRCDTRVGTKTISCGTCGVRFPLRVPHWHHGCDMNTSGACPGCGTKEPASFCDCPRS